MFVKIKNKSEILTLSNISQWTHKEQESVAPDWNSLFDFPFKNVNFGLLEGESFRSQNFTFSFLRILYEKGSSKYVVIYIGSCNVITLVLSGTSSMASNFDFSSITTCFSVTSDGEFWGKRSTAGRYLLSSRKKNT